MNSSVALRRHVEIIPKMSRFSDHQQIFAAA
jgi:hypothetical protein